MKPYYQDEMVTLYCGAFQDVLPALDYPKVQAVRDDMLTPPSEPRGTKQPQRGPSKQSQYVQRRLAEAVTDRPWHTYFGPADPDVIADLIAALFPHDRRGGRAA